MVEKNTNVVRAIDLGYGFTKITKNIDAKGNIKTYSFPSFATVAGKKTIGGGFLKNRGSLQ